MSEHAEVLPAGVETADDSLAVARMDRLITHSSFGTAGARSLRGRTSASVVDTIMTGTVFVDPTPAVGPAASSDRRAVDRLMAQIRPLIVRYCRARVGRQERSFASADDVAQEVCLAVLAALPSYRDQGRPFLAFVYGIAAHKVADAHRAAARNRTEPVAEVPDMAESNPGPEQTAMRAELSEEMGALLQVLPHNQREIIVLRVVYGMSAEETAEAIGSTPGAVRVAQHRALTRLRQVMAETFHDEMEL